MHLFSAVCRSIAPKCGGGQSVLDGVRDLRDSLPFGALFFKLYVFGMSPDAGICLIFVLCYLDK